MQTFAPDAGGLHATGQSMKLSQDRRAAPRHLTLLLGSLALALLASGCATQKTTWGQWMQAEPRMTRMPAMPVVPCPFSEPAPVIFRPGYSNGIAASVGPGMDLAARNPDFPATHIAMIYVDLTTPSNSVYLTWTGPQAAQGPIGPWRSCPGRGKPCFDCDKVADSNTVDSWCTPKGLFAVAGFDDRLEGVPSCCYVTWVIHDPRYIGLHSYHDIPYQSVSHGCVRLPFEVAKLIHNNSLAGTTHIFIYGTWTRPIGLQN